MGFWACFIILTERSAVKLTNRNANFAALPIFRAYALVHKGLHNCVTVTAALSKQLHSEIRFIGCQFRFWHMLSHTSVIFSSLPFLSHSVYYTIVTVLFSEARLLFIFTTHCAVNVLVIVSTYARVSNIRILPSINYISKIRQNHVTTEYNQVNSYFPSKRNTN